MGRRNNQMRQAVMARTTAPKQKKPATKQPAKPKKSQADKYSKMPWNKLRTLASKRKVLHRGMNRQAVEKALRAA
ncbi:MAG: hypothetical protein COA96_14130 [SAR86 cluster bacterium]|uniref:Uncharacterized protein n=1 Tax=SAR86 cluster bacterium TaxID=2030880 RepID=A0A2A5AT87_9GAMM|nr:MAG: hypothetical protein COA96_14130 [SAR86 cluster bacterium]